MSNELDFLLLLTKVQKIVEDIIFLEIEIMRHCTFSKPAKCLLMI